MNITKTINGMARTVQLAAMQQLNILLEENATDNLRLLVLLILNLNLTHLRTVSKTTKVKLYNYINFS